MSTKAKNRSPDGAATEGEDTAPDKRQEREARNLVKDHRRQLERRKKRLKPAEIERMEGAIRGVQEELDSARPLSRRKLAVAVKQLDDAVHEVLGFDKKSNTREFFESIVVAVIVAAILRAFVIEAFKIPSGSMIPTLEVGDHIFVNKFIYGLRIPFTNAWFVEWGTPSRGDVIVFRYPKDTSKDYIKRVVAVAGDKVHVDGREVFVNGRRLDRKPPEQYDYFEDAEPGDEPTFQLSRKAEAFVEHNLSEKPKEYTVLYSSDDAPRPTFPNGTELPGLDCSYDSPGRQSECRVQDDFVFVMGDNRDNSSDSRAWGGVPTNHVKGRAMFVWWSRGQRSGVRWGRMGKGID